MKYASEEIGVGLYPLAGMATRFTAINEIGLREHRCGCCRQPFDAALIAPIALVLNRTGEPLCLGCEDFAEFGRVAKIVRAALPGDEFVATMSAAQRKWFDELDRAERENPPELTLLQLVARQQSQPDPQR